MANPRLMEGSKRRKRKSDRIDANKLARLGRVDPQSLYPIRHRSREVRQDLVVLRARDALVSVRTELINTARGLVKSMGTRLPPRSSRLRVTLPPMRWQQRQSLISCRCPAAPPRSRSNYWTPGARILRPSCGPRSPVTSSARIISALAMSRMQLRCSS